ncbi:MAG: alpha-hydroxy-acid oxidizing enzyme [Chloroflexi bacterium]|nr:MAG: alpha-hydroxy-acid oxidizing enzyme [Chloroflexota bacterium]
MNLADIEAAARAVVPPPQWDYIAGGAADETTLAENSAAYRRIRLRPRVLRDVAQRDLTTTVLGEPIAFPVLLAPVSPLSLACPQAELLAARAAAQAGVRMIAPTQGAHTIHELAAQATAPLWFQLYPSCNRAVTEALIDQAQAAGCTALVVTLSAFYASFRERDRRSGYSVPAELWAANLLHLPGVRPDDPDFDRVLPITWADLAWIRARTTLPLVLKGIMTAEDAELAVEQGIAGLIVSNHGGRQLDGTLPTIEALPEVVEGAAGRCEVYLDGGIRRGTDVLKALALGARAVCIGRPYVWGLAWNGEAGVLRVLEQLRSELDSAMAQMGRRTIADLDR